MLFLFFFFNYQAIARPSLAKDALCGPIDSCGRDGTVSCDEVKKAAGASNVGAAVARYQEKMRTNFGNIPNNVVGVSLNGKQDKIKQCCTTGTKPIGVFLDCLKKKLGC